MIETVRKNIQVKVLSAYEVSVDDASQMIIFECEVPLVLNDQLVDRISQERYQIRSMFQHQGWLETKVYACDYTNQPMSTDREYFVEKYEDAESEVQLPEGPTSNDLLKEAIFEIKSLRNQLQLANARLEMFDAIQAMLHTDIARRGNGMSEDIVAKIEMHLRSSEGTKSNPNL